MGWPAKRAGGVAGELAGANAVRNPGRTASTAAALMIGLTLVTVVAVLGAGLKAATERRSTTSSTPATSIDGEQTLPFRASEGDKLAATPGVTAASHVRSDTALVQGEEAGDHRDRPGHDRPLLRVRLGDGSEDALAQLGTDGAVVTKDYAEAEDLAVGGKVCPHDAVGREARRWWSAASTTRRRPSSCSAPSAWPSRRFDDGVRRAEEQLHVPRRRCRRGARRSRRRPKELGDVKYHTGAGYPKDATKEMDTILAMLYVLLGFSVIVSLFGMVNTMVLSVFERTREIGMLRTIGMTRRQARRMIRHESVITALIGATLGLGLGVFLAALVTKALSSYDIAFDHPGADAGRVHPGGRARRDRRGDPARPPRLTAQRAGRPPVRVAAPPWPPSRRPRGGAAGVGFTSNDGSRR